MSWPRRLRDFAIHATIKVSDRLRCDSASGEYPLNCLILGGESLYDEPDYIVSLKISKEVADVAAAPPGIAEEALRLRYFAIELEDYGLPLTEEDFQYT